MDKFTVHTGTALPLRRSNVDTDQIIPAEYLKRVTRTGFADGLFAAWRADPAFVLNDNRYDGATVLLAGPDFGTGSSREHAVWALQDYGFRAVIAPRFGDKLQLPVSLHSFRGHGEPQRVSERDADIAQHSLVGEIALPTRDG